MALFQWKENVYNKQPAVTVSPTSFGVLMRLWEHCGAGLSCSMSIQNTERQSMCECDCEWVWVWMCVCVQCVSLQSSKSFQSTQTHFGEKGRVIKRYERQSLALVWKVFASCSQDRSYSVSKTVRGDKWRLFTTRGRTHWTAIHCELFWSILVYLLVFPWCFGLSQTFSCFHSLPMQRMSICVCK